MSLEEVRGLLEGGANDPSTFSEETLDSTYPGRVPRGEYGIAGNEGSDLLRDIEDFMEEVLKAVYTPYIDLYAPVGPVTYIPPRPASDESAELEKRSEELQESIGLNARVDNYQVTDLEGGAMASYSIPRSPRYSENVVSMDTDFHKYATDKQKDEALLHELIHSCTDRYERATGDLLEERSSVSFNDKAVREEINQMDRWYDIAQDASYSEDMREVAERELEKRTQWLTEAVLGQRSQGLGYPDATQEFDNYMRTEYGADMTDVDGIYDDAISVSRGPTPSTSVARKVQA